MITKILLALDGSHRAAHVARVAGELALKFGATIFPFRAILIPAEFPAAGAGSEPDLLPQAMYDESEHELRALVAPLVGVDVVAPLVRVGDASHAILTAAEDLGVDLIVLGSHGFHGWDRLLGTTAGSVSNRAVCSVLVVRETDHLRATKGVHSP